MTPSSKMSRVERDLLNSIRGNIWFLRRFGRALASRAEPDFSMQTDVSIEDLVLPLKLGRFPDEKMFASSSQFFELSEIFNFVVCCQYAAGFDDPLFELYVAAVTLNGIVRHQSPESGEFGIAQTCLVLLRSSRAVTSVPKQLVASFANELKQHVIHDPAPYWDADWIVVSLLATTLALTSTPSARSDLQKELSECLCRAEWQAALSQKKSDPDYASSVRALEVLLAAC